MLGIALALLAADEGFLDKTIDVEGKSTKYVVYIPPGSDAKKPQPCILFLHGAGETGEDGKKQAAVGLGPAIKAAPDAWKFVVIFPQKPPGKTQWISHEKMLLAMLEKTKGEVAIDEKRICLTGLSMGGYGTWMLAAKHPQLFAAAAPICGGGRPADGPKLKDLPIWCFHGDKDTAVPLSRSQEMIDAIKTAGGKPEFTIYPGVGHNSWDKAYREEKLHEWFLKHSAK